MWGAPRTDPSRMWSIVRRKPASRRMHASEGYDRAAAHYDRRWAAYTAATLSLLRPYLSEPAGRLLDVGCGTGALLRAMNDWRVAPERYLGVDRSLGMLEAARRRGVPGLVRAEAAALPLDAGCMDRVVTASSLHDWPDLDAGLGEARRVLTSDGRLLVLDWCADYASIRLMRRWLAITGRPVAEVLTATELVRRLAAAGFAPGPVHRARISPIWGMMVCEAAVR
jgi:ubiquinone/menaquinone biosynthesis C-methylase UbiE